jgi:hypothetical protein
MLDARQARFIETYFQSLSTSVTGASLGMTASEARNTMSEPAVSEAVRAVMSVLLDDIAAFGGCLHGLPKQGCNRRFVVKVAHCGG